MLTKKILFSLMPTLILLFVVELFFRLVPFYQDSNHTKSGFVIQDEELGWRLKPRNNGPLATNELGLRDTPYNRKADKKILLLGDSVSWGDGISNLKDAYPFLLEKMLNQSGDLSYEVINSGVPGYSTFQQLRYLQLYGMGFDPDVIILQFCLNDVVERYTSITEYGGDNVFLGVDTRSFIPGINGWMIRNSRAYESLIRLLMNLARDQQEYDVMKMASDQLSDELDSAWNLTLSEIQGINKIANDNNIPLIIVIAPYRFQLDQPHSLNQPQQKLLKYSRENNIAVVDLLPLFATLHTKNSSYPLFRDANHFSIYGHFLASRILYKEVLAFLARTTPKN